MSRPAESHFRDLFETAFHEHDPESTKKEKEAQNVRHVEQLLMTFMSGNYEALHDFLSDDMEIVGPEGAIMVGRHHGLPAVIRYTPSGRGRSPACVSLRKRRRGWRQPEDERRYMSSSIPTRTLKTEPRYHV